MKHKSSWARNREIDEGLSQQPLTQLLKMNPWFLNALGMLPPLGSFRDKLARILDAFWSFILLSLVP